MSRLHADPVEVRTRVAESGPVPDQFLWRGRLYLVREVLARWTESGSWWRGTAVRALTTGSGTVSVPFAPPSRDWAQSASLAGGAAPRRSLAIDDRETQWWRVEADSGRLAALSGGPGVYDLCFEESTSGWSLKRVMD
jgi:hypothetical protein